MAVHAPTFVYKIYPLEPSLPNFPFLVGKYAALFLLALSTNPEAFGVAYSTEAALTPADIAKRLSRPNVTVFVCVAHSSESPLAEQSVERGAWVGMVTQVGPTPRATYWLPHSGAPEPLEDDAETKWHQTTLWIDPAHRGKGLAPRMIEAAMAFAVASSPHNVTQARFRAFTGPDNKGSLGLYGRWGAVPVGKCTIPEAMVANGNTAYPFHGRTDWEEEFLQARLGIIMEKVVKIDGAPRAGAGEAGVSAS